MLRKVCGKVENGDRRRVVEEVMRKRPEFFLQSQGERKIRDVMKLKTDRFSY